MNMKFRQFEKMTNLLETYSIDELMENPSLTEGMDMNELCQVNNYLFESSLYEIDDTLNEFVGLAAGLGALAAGGIAGLFAAGSDALKNAISAKIPGSALNKANKILKQYANMKMEMLQDIGKERTKAFKAKSAADDNPNDKAKANIAKEIQDRVNDSIDAIKKAKKQEQDAIEKQLNILAKNKGDRVKDYIELALAKLKVEIAQKELKDAKAYASEEQIEELQKSIEDMRKDAKAKEQVLSTVLKADKGGQEAPAVEVKRDDVNVGDVWLMKPTGGGANHNIEVISKDKNGKGQDIDAGSVWGKNPENNKEYLVSLKSLVKNVKKGEEKKAA